MHKNHVYRHEIREHSKTVRKGHLHVYTKSGNKRRAIHNDHLYISVYEIQKQNKTMYADHIYIYAYKTWIIYTTEPTYLLCISEGTQGSRQVLYHIFMLVF